MNDTYNFGRGYQVKLLGMCCRQRTFLLAYRDLVRPQWFEDDVLIDLCRLIVQYFDKYKSAPTMEALRESAAEMLRTDERRAQRGDEYSRVIEEIESANLEEGPDVTDRVVRWARKQAVWNCIESMGQDANEEQYLGFEKRLSEALLTGNNRLDLGIDYFTDENRFHDDRTKHTITTGLPTLDRYLKGGSAPAELCIVEAPTGQFKTGCMVNFASAALWHGCDVVYCSLEVKPPQVARRFDGAMLGKVTENATPAHILQELQKHRERLQGNLRIRYWPSGTASLTDIRAYLHALAAEGIIDPANRPMVLFIDYGQILKPESHYSEKRHEVRAIYQGMIPLGEEFNCPVWTGMQSNRAAETKALITKADLAECYAVASDAHIILSLNQTKAERDDNIMRVYIAKSRESQSFLDVEVTVNKDLTSWKELHQNWPYDIEAHTQDQVLQTAFTRGLETMSKGMTATNHRRIFGQG